MRQTIRSLERLKLPRYQVMAYELLTSLLLDLDLNQQAFETSERGLARRRLPRESSSGAYAARRRNAIARMRLGDLEVGPALNGTLSRARENDERSQMVRCLEGLAELALRRGELDACSALGDGNARARRGRRDEGAGGARTPMARRGARSGGQARLGLRAARARRSGRREDRSCASRTRRHRCARQSRRRPRSSARALQLSGAHRSTARASAGSSWLRNDGCRAQ